MTSNAWIDAGSTDALWDGAGIGVVVQGREIALFRIGDAVYATDALCTHGQARLCEGFIEGHEIECPLHQGRFDLRSGAPTCEPAAEALRTYPARIAGARVEVELPRSPEAATDSQSNTPMSNTSSFAAFEANARACGFTTVLERQWAPDVVLETHSHPFAVQARVVQGEMWLTVGERTRHLQPGDTFELDPDVPHAERYGSAGATYWVARR